MLGDNLLLASAVGLAVGLLMVALYYRMIVEPLIPYNVAEQEWDHQPTLDDDMIGVTYSMYPYHEPIYYINPLPNQDHQNSK